MTTTSYLLGIDLGSSSVKVTLVAAESRLPVASVQYPPLEMPIQAPEPGWAEQHPEVWWENTCLAIKQAIQQSAIDPGKIASVGIAYQMHGLVVVDRAGAVLRPAIIWCDSRAVSIGQRAYMALGADYCQAHYLNSPGNFTASKLKWVRDHEPELFSKIYKIMLPGDFIAYRLTGQMSTTVSGLSEGILWDFLENKPAQKLLDHYGLDNSLLPELTETLGFQGAVHAAAAAATGLKVGTPIAYRAGDQPNNALSLQVLSPGEVAATGGTSGVVYAVTDALASDPGNRVNSFAHVNHQVAEPRIGVLLCINGAGILYSWLRKNAAESAMTYGEMEALAATAPMGSDGLAVLPFGNGAERILGNTDLGAHILNLQFNRHTRAHLFRAALEGIAFSFAYGMQILRTMGVKSKVIRVGNDNLFQSAIFSETVAALTGCRIEVLKTNGATGAALAGGVGAGVYAGLTEALAGIPKAKTYAPRLDMEPVKEAYTHWVRRLDGMMPFTDFACN